MLAAITRSVSPTINDCELTYLERQPIDFAKATDQHLRYVRCLCEMGLRVITLPAEPDLPDAVFVEDPAVVVGEVAVIARMGAESRRREAESMARALEPFRPLRWIRSPGTLEGGDVFRAGRRLFAGISDRTNAEGIAQLSRELEPFGYTVAAVNVRDCLHLKSACCYLGDETVVANRAWIDASPLAGFRMIDVAPGEDLAADVLAIGKTVLIPACFPATAERIERAGWKVQPVDVSELMKAEAGVTCMSVVFDMKG